MTSNDVRFAAEVLLSQSAAHPQNDNLTSLEQHQRSQVPSVSASLSSLDRLPSESVLLGSRNNGHMSIVRRFFCLFVLFDLLLISLLWFIWLVMCAACRFTVLLLFYGVLNSSSRIYVAFTTAGTCLFLVPKISYFNWPEASEPVLLVLLFVICFILAWGEAWFLDFRVLPQEAHANDYINNTNRVCDPTNRGFTPSTRPYNPSEPASNFYSPMESPDVSDNEDNISSPLFPDYQKKMSETIERTWEILNSEGWQLEKLDKDAAIYTKHVKGLGMFYLMKTTVKGSKESIMRELFDNIFNVTTWNPTITVSKRLEQINDNTDIIYQVTAPVAKGVISPRDFVILRCKTVKDDRLFSAGISIPYKHAPKVPRVIRGETGPCCWSLEKGPEGFCNVDCLIRIDLKGWIPKHLIHSAMYNILIDTGKHLRLYMASLKEC